MGLPEGTTINLQFHFQGYKFSNFPITIKLWNKLPEETVNATSINDFTDLHTWLFVFDFFCTPVLLLYSLARFCNYNNNNAKRVCVYVCLWIRWCKDLNVSCKLISTDIYNNKRGLYSHLWGKVIWAVVSHWTSSYRASIAYWYVARPSWFTVYRQRYLKITYRQEVIFHIS